MNTCTCTINIFLKSCLAALISFITICSLVQINFLKKKTLVRQVNYSSYLTPVRLTTLFQSKVANGHFLFFNCLRVPRTTA